MERRRRCIVCLAKLALSDRTCPRCGVSTQVTAETVQDALRALGPVLAHRPLDEQQAKFLAEWARSLLHSEPTQETAKKALGALGAKFPGMEPQLSRFPEVDALDVCLMLAFLVCVVAFGGAAIAGVEGSPTVTFILGSGMNITFTVAENRIAQRYGERVRMLEENGRALRDQFNTLDKSLSAEMSGLAPAIVKEWDSLMMVLVASRSSEGSVAPHHLSAGHDVVRPGVVFGPQEIQGDVPPPPKRRPEIWKAGTKPGRVEGVGITDIYPHRGRTGYGKMDADDVELVKNALEHEIALYERNLADRKRELKALKGIVKPRTQI